MGSCSDVNHNDLRKYLPMMDTNTPGHDDAVQESQAASGHATHTEVLLYIVINLVQKIYCQRSFIKTSLLEIH